MPYKDVYLVAVESDFVHACTIAAVAVCADVAQEATSVANHVNRVVLMKQVLGDPDVWGKRFAYAVAMLGGTGASTDAQLKTFVGNAWNAMSGVA